MKISKPVLYGAAVAMMSQMRCQGGPCRSCLGCIGAAACLIIPVYAVYLKKKGKKDAVDKTVN